MAARILFFLYVVQLPNCRHVSANASAAIGIILFGSWRQLSVPKRTFWQSCIREEKNRRISPGCLFHIAYSNYCLGIQIVCLLPHFIFLQLISSRSYVALVHKAFAERDEIATIEPVGSTAHESGDCNEKGFAVIIQASRPTRHRHCSPFWAQSHTE